MVALWVRLGTLVAGDTPLGIRLLGPLSVAVASLLLADAADRLLPGRRAGLLAAALLNATLLFGVGAVIMTPDTPLLFFWTCCLWALARLLASAAKRAVVAGGRAVRRPGDGQQVHRRVALVRNCAVAAGRRRRCARLAAAPGAMAWRAAGRWRCSCPCCCGMPRTAGRASPDRAAASADWQPDRAPSASSANWSAGRSGSSRRWSSCCSPPAWSLAARQAWRTRDPAWTLLAALTLPAGAGVHRSTRSATGCRATGRRSSIPPPRSPPAALPAPPGNGCTRPALALGFAITLLRLSAGQPGTAAVAGAARSDRAAPGRLGRARRACRIGVRQQQARGVRRGGSVRRRRRTRARICPRAFRSSGSSRAGHCSICRTRRSPAGPASWCRARMASPTSTAHDGR